MNCKKGDLAYVVCGMSVGAVVEVVVDAPPYDGDPAWVCTSTSALPVAKHGQLFADRVATKFRVRDSWLRPISGVPVEEEQHDEVSV